MMRDYTGRISVPMLMRTILFASITAVVTSQIPGLLSLMPVADNMSANLIDPAATGSLPSSLPSTASSPTSAARLTFDGQGHFVGTFSVNGKSIAGMVDTGATYVALNQSVAAKLGLSPAAFDFRYPVNTANGRTSAAKVTLSEITVGNVRVSNVEALVLKDEALSTTLIGMSFLNKLSSYSVSDGALSLNQ